MPYRPSLHRPAAMREAPSHRLEIERAKRVGFGSEMTERGTFFTRDFRTVPAMSQPPIWKQSLDGIRVRSHDDEV